MQTAKLNFATPRSAVKPEALMRYLPVLSVLLLAACSDDSMTRNFSLSRD